jgi:hypothetical protein
MGCLIFGHLIARWAAALVDYLAKPSKRQDSQTRMRVCGACLKALFSNQAAVS